MKLILLTSTSLRHKYIATQLAEQFDLQLIISEGKSEKIEDTSMLSEEDASFISHHFAQREASEREFFGNFQDFPKDIPLRELPHGEINSEEISDLVEHMGPDYIILFGSSILKSSLMDSYRSRIINLHLGLSPYYTGSATNLFPFYYNEPEGVGATIHLASNKVDEGEVLHQLRPEIAPKDDLHHIGNKIILKSGKQLPGVLKGFASHNLTPQPQLPAGKICHIKDFTPEMLRDIYAKFESGIIKEYLQDKAHRDAAQPIVDADLQLD